MSVFSEGLKSAVNVIVEKHWTERNGQVIPKSEDVQLGNDRVNLDAVLLYADLADSTELALKNKEIAAEVYKAYLAGVSKIIRHHGGHIRSFDGDRVMGVFLDGAKNTNAVRCGLEVNWFFTEALIPKFKSFYSVSLNDFQFAQTVGIDAGEIHVARGGIHIHNDLIWVGRAPNIAAKLSSTRWPNVATLITPIVYNVMLDEAKLSPTTGENMWKYYSWDAGKPYGIDTVYGSSWWVRPD